MTDLEYIVSKLSADEILCQVAEEASEFAQAALKLRRAINGTNPTPKTVEEAFTNYIEEMGDCSVAERAYFQATREDTEWVGEVLSGMIREKTARWAERLRAKDTAEG